MTLAQIVPTFVLSLLLLVQSAIAEPFKLGAIIHLTGDIAAPSASFREGIELAVAEINNERKVKFQLILEDGQNSPKVSYLAGQKLLNRDRVHAVILESMIDVMSSGMLFERAGIPSICIWDANPEIESAGKHIFAIGPWTPSAGETSAQFAREKLGARRAVVFTNVDTWSESVGRYFTAKFIELGGEIIESYNINPQDTEFRTSLTKALSKQPDVIYSPMVFNLPAFYTQLKMLGNRAPVISSDIIAEEYIREAPDAFEGVYQTGVRDPDSPDYLTFEGKFLAHFGRKPDHAWFAAVGYDAVKLFEKALDVTSGGKTSISEALYGIKDFRGASNEISINPQGTSLQNEVMFRVKNGRLQIVN